MSLLFGLYGGRTLVFIITLTRRWSYQYFI